MEGGGLGLGLGDGWMQQFQHNKFLWQEILAISLIAKLGQADVSPQIHSHPFYIHVNFVTGLVNFPGEIVTHSYNLPSIQRKIEALL